MNMIYIYEVTYNDPLSGTIKLYLNFKAANKRAANRMLGEFLAEEPYDVITTRFLYETF